LLRIERFQYRLEAFGIVNEQLQVREGNLYIRFIEGISATTRYADAQTIHREQDSWASVSGHGRPLC